MMKLSYMWDGHPTTFVVLSLYCLFHSLCKPKKALILLQLSLNLSLSNNNFDGRTAVMYLHHDDDACLVVEQTEFQLWPADWRTICSKMLMT